MNDNTEYQINQKLMQEIELLRDKVKELEKRIFELEHTEAGRTPWRPE